MSANWLRSGDDRVSPPSEPPSLSDEAREYEQRGELGSALRAYRALEQAHPHDPAVELRTANVLRRMQRSDDAVEEYVHAARDYAAEGQRRRAIASLRAALRLAYGVADRRPERVAQIGIEIAQLELEDGFRPDAMHTLREVLDVLRRVGASEAALEIATWIADELYDDLPFLELRAEALLAAGQRSYAEQAYANLIVEYAERAPDHALAQLLERFFDLDPAEGHLPGVARAVCDRTRTAGAPRSLGIIVARLSARDPGAVGDAYDELRRRSEHYSVVPVHG